ncbi:MAG: hypothetical protein AAF467_14180 [Actinomycetota bacterium]
MTGSVRAVIEIGAVTTRLLVRTATGVSRHAVDLRLGGLRLGATGTLSSVAVADTSLAALHDILSQFAIAISDAGGDPGSTRVVGTAAMRGASNPDAVAAVVDRVLGAELEILADDVEARLGYLGALAALGSTPAADREVVLVDLGGAATPVVIGGPDGPRGSYVIPVGGALLSETYLESDPPRPAELSAALSVVELHIDDVVRTLAAVAPLVEAARQDEPEAFVVVTGTAEIIAAIEIGLGDVDPRTGEGPGPVHGFELTREAAEDVFRTLATEAFDDRRHNPGLPAGRVDDVVGACAVLVEFMRQWDLEHVIVSQAGLLDGVLSEAVTGSEFGER